MRRKNRGSLICLRRFNCYCQALTFAKLVCNAIIASNVSRIYILKFYDMLATNLVYYTSLILGEGTQCSLPLLNRVCEYPVYSRLGEHMPESDKISQRIHIKCYIKRSKSVT